MQRTLALSYALEAEAYSQEGTGIPSNLLKQSWGGRVLRRGAGLPVGAGEEVHRNKEQGSKLNDPDPRRPNVQHCCQQAAAELSIRRRFGERSLRAIL